MSSKAGKLAKNIKEEKVNKNVEGLAKNLVMMGKCTCGGDLYMYLGADKKDIFNVYCMGDCGHVSDVRFPKAGDQYFVNAPNTPLKAISEVWKSEKIEVTDEDVEKQPMSILVGKNLGEEEKCEEDKKVKKPRKSTKKAAKSE